jgi:hypothetical protein
LWTTYEDNGKEVVGYTTQSFHDVISRELNNLSSDSDNVVFCAHNLQFDFWVLMRKAKFRNCKKTIRYCSKPVFCIYERTFTVKQTRVRAKKSGRGKRSNKKTKKVVKRIYFVDLANYVGRKPLKDVAKDFNLPPKLDSNDVLEIDDKKINWKELKEYCVRDSEIVTKAILALNVVRDENKLNLTISSKAFRSIKDETGWKAFDRPKYVREAERSAFYGGRVYVNQEFIRKEIHGYKYDVHSMYPSVMAKMSVPVEYLGKRGFLKGEFDTKTLVEIYKDTFRTGIVQAKVYCYEEVLPVRDEGKLYFRKGENYGFWHLMEFIPALLKNEIRIMQLYSMFEYRCEPLMFEKWVLPRYEIKRTSKGVKKQVAKLEMNSCYGKFVERRIVERSPEELGLTDSDLEDLLFANNIDELGSFELIIADKTYKFEKQGEDVFCAERLNDDAYGACCVVGGEVTAIARRKLWDEGIRGRRCYYTDTDSCIIPNKLPEELLHKDALGMWDLEHECEFIIKGRKMYECEHVRHLKGVPKSFVEIEPDVWQGELPIKPKEALRRKLPAYSLITVTKKV